MLCPPEVSVAVSAYASALQAGLACIFILKAEDRFYGLSGSAGFLSTTLVFIYYPYNSVAQRDFTFLTQECSSTTTLGSEAGPTHYCPCRVVIEARELPGPESNQSG